MESPTPLWLTDVKYLERKKAIAVEFSQLNFKRMVRFSFFPSFFVGKKLLEISELKKILSKSMERFAVFDSDNAFKISASTFSGLNNLAKILFNKTGFKPVVINPERQFLLEKNWTYLPKFISINNSYKLQ